MDKIAAAEPVSEDPDLIEPMAAFASALAHQIQTLATEIGKLDKQLIPRIPLRLRPPDPSNDITKPPIRV